jgi:hypothetical protein
MDEDPVVFCNNRSCKGVSFDSGVNRGVVGIVRASFDLKMLSSLKKVSDLKGVTGIRNGQTMKRKRERDI